MEYLLRTDRAELIEAVIAATDTDLHAPALCDVEVSAALRHALLTGRIDEPRALEALDDYLDLPLTTHGHRALVARILALRHSFSAYDAAYVALAERIGGTLVTADQALIRAIQGHALVDLIGGTTPEGG